MDAIPIAGFFAALILTTIFFDQLEADQYGLSLQLVYAGIWGLLGAAVILIAAMQSPHTVTSNAYLLGGGLALGTTTEVIHELVKHQRLSFRNMRWMVAGIIVFSSTYLLIQHQHGEVTSWQTTQQRAQNTTKWSMASKTIVKARPNF
jgi:uncharacterized membrane protein